MPIIIYTIESYSEASRSISVFDYTPDGVTVCRVGCQHARSQHRPSQDSFAQSSFLRSI